MVSRRQIESLRNRVAAAFINAGLIDPKGKSSSEILNAVRKIAYDLPSDFDVVVDHTPELLKLARAYRRTHANGFSLLMYATWIEHNLNLLLVRLATEAKVSDKYINGMLRDASAKSKATWILAVLGVKPFSSRYQTSLQRLLDARNAFVHYKWNKLSEDEKAEQGSVLSHAESLVRELMRYKRVHARLLSEKTVRKYIYEQPNTYEAPARQEVKGSPLERSTS